MGAVSSLIGIIGGLTIGLLISYGIWRRKYRLSLKKAEEKAKSIIEAAQKEAHDIRISAQSELKRKLQEQRRELEKSLANRKREVEERERRLSIRERELDRKLELLERREKLLAKKETDINYSHKRVAEKLKELDNLIQQENVILEKIAGLSREEAKQKLLNNMREEAELEAKQFLLELKEKVERNAKAEVFQILTTVMNRYIPEIVADQTTSVVHLPSDDLKGKLIGREGRNIRAFEQATGVDLIIDDTPLVVSVSSFNPVRREIARRALEKLVADGRIHPGRIEEVVKEVREEVERFIVEKGEETITELGISGLHPELIKLLGELHFRTSYGQNVLQHSKEVAHIATLLGAELGLDDDKIEEAKRAGLLHDIGKAISQEEKGSHQQIGAEIARKYGESEIIVNAIAAHHRDVEPLSEVAVVVELADAISSARPGARRETLDAYIQRVGQLEEIAQSFDGVMRAFAIQAGREVRVIVHPDKVKDDDLVLLADKIAKKIEREMKYPGEIKVTVLREVQAVQYAK